MVQTIIRNGYDQCQIALRKLTSRRFYKLCVQQQQQASGLPIIFLGNQVDVRELQLDALGQAAEEILSQLRHYSSLFRRLREDEDASVEIPSASEEGSLRSSSSYSFHQQLLASQAALPSPPLPYSLDIHPYARRKKRQQNDHDRRPVEQRRPRNSKQRKKIRTFRGDQVCEDDLEKEANAEALSDDQPLSDGERSRDSASSSSFYQILVASQSPSQPPPSRLYQKNLEPRRRIESMRSRKFQSSEVHGDQRNRNEMDLGADFGYDTSGSSDMDLNRTDTDLDISNGNGVRGGSGKDKTTASLLQERSSAWLMKDHVRRHDKIKKDKHQMRRPATVSSEAVFLHAMPNDENQPSNVHKAGDSFISSSTSFVPEIEALLPLPPSDMQGLKRVEGRQRNARSTAKRMEKWLESNADDLLANQTNSSDSLGRTRNLPLGDLNLPWKQRQERRPAMISPNTMRATQSRLFSTIGKGGSSCSAFTEANQRKISDLKSFCHDMVSLESNDLLNEALNDVCLWFENGNVVSSSDAHFAFQSMVELLLKDDMIALQFLVSNESPNVCRFISVVVALLRLLRCKANEKMSVSDVLWNIFSKDRCKVFLDLVVLQLVDTLLSLFHPQAWDLRVRNSQNVLEQLKPLRNELACHFDLVERACQSLSKEIGTQEWRCVRGGDCVYVSSIDPDDWRSFLTSGAVPPKPITIRVAAFDDVYPRCEVDAIWCLVGFLAGADTYNNSSEDNRWHFFSQLLSKGSLSVSQGPDRLPPPKDQMEAAVEDLTNLTTLIASGVLGNIPRRDTILVDLIQKCVSVECDFVEANGFSWTPVAPSIKREKLILELSRLFEQPTSDTPKFWNFKRDTFLSFLRDLSAPEIEISWMNKPLLLPSSRLLRCCLALLLAWKSQIPREKVKRLQCLENVIKALVKSLTSENSSADATSPQCLSTKRDAFLDAFTSLPNDESLTESGRSLVRTEIAAYIALFSLFDFNSDCEMVTSLSQFDVEATCDLLWSIVSDDMLRQRRDWLSSRGNKCKPMQKYNGDVIRLYNATKVLCLLGILIAGDHPFRLDAIFSSPPADEGGSVRTVRSALSSLTFVLSTLIACLDCICDLKYSPEAFSSIVICTFVVLNALDNVSSISNNGTLVVSIASTNRESLRNAVHIFTASQTLQRVFNTVLCSQASGFEADMCFQSVILAIRYVLKIYPKNASTESAIPQVGTSGAAGMDEDFGEIDDAVLANLNLCITSEGTKALEQDLEWIYSIFNVLVDAVLSSKPSSRNCIYPTLPSETELVISAQGMGLVSKNAELICAILAEVAATRWYPSCPMNTLWNVGSRFSCFDDQDDILYMKAVGICISRQLCRSYSSTTVRNIMRDGGESALFNLLESMIDYKLLRKIPSCNLDRIRLNGGSSAEEQGFAELFDFKNGYPKRLKNRLDEIRSFCHDASHALFNGNESSDFSPTISTFRRVLLNFTVDAHPVELVPSLEREMLDRFKLFQGLLFEARTQDTTITSFERLSALLLTSCSYELIHLLQRIGIQDQAHADVKHENYGCSKLFETVACLSELLVSLISETIRCHGCLHTSKSSDDFMAMLRHICDHFACPLLDGRSLNLMTVLCEIVLYGSSFLKGVNPNLGRIGNLVSPNFDLQRYCELLRKSFTRRTRELVVAIASSTASEPKWKSSKLLNSILVAGTSNDVDAATFVAQCFCSREFYVTFPDPMPGLLSPIEHAINKQFAQMENTTPIGDHLATALHTLKRFALQDFAIPKLLKQGIDARSKVLLLRFIQCIFDHDRNERLQNRSCADLQFDVLLLCSLARVIGMSIRNILDSNTADDTLVSSLYTCARALMNLPASCLYPNSIGWLVDWAYPSPNMTSNTMHSNYLWYFCCWLRDFGSLILDTPDKTHLRMLRDEAKMAEPASFWIPLGTNELSLSISRHLIDLEQQIFPESGSTRDVMKLNRYKTSVTVRSRETHHDVTENASSVPLDEWEPSADVRYAVHQFIEKIKFATPTR
jgi:hypothetical protein